MKKTHNTELERQKKMFGLFFILPMLLVLFSVAFYPLFQTIMYSFTDARLNTLDSYNFNFLRNYLDYYDGRFYGVLADGLWWTAVWNTLFFTVISVGLETILGLAVALILHQSFKMRGIVRTIILVPWAVPTVVSAKMWGMMYNDQFGVINDMLMKVHIISEPIAWAAHPTYALSAVIVVDVWKTMPFMALLLLAALQTVPEEIHEAARIDGAGAIQHFIKITLPLIKPALIVALIFRSLDALRVFDLIYVMTSNSAETISISGYARQTTVDFQDVGLGSAASALVFLIVAGVAIFYLKVGRVNLSEGTSR